MNTLAESAVTIGLAIVGVAMLAVFLSKNSNTAAVIQAGSSGFVNSLGTALSPVTGSQVNIVSSYPGTSFGPSSYA